MTELVASLRQWFPPQGPTRRSRVVDVSLAFAFVLLLFYLVMGMRFLPDLSIRLLIAGVVGVAVALSGPGLTMPLYFATWFGNAIPAPGLPFSMNRLLAAAFFLSWLISIGKRHFRLPHVAPLAILVFYTIYAIVVSYWLRVPGEPLNIQQLMYMAVTIMVASTWRDRAEFTRLVGVLLTMTCAINSIGLVEYVTRRDLFPQFSDWVATRPEYLRINGICRNAIDFAYTSTWALPWALFLHIEGRTARVRRLALVAMVFLALLCLLTYNRQSPFMLAAILVAGLTLVKYRHRGKLLALMFVAGLSVAPFFLPSIIFRFSQLGNDVRPDPSIAMRADKLLVARQMIVQYPLFGVGLNNFKDKWWEYRIPGEMYIIHFERHFRHYVDLGYVQIITETGLIGLACFLALVVTTFSLWLKWYRIALCLPHSFHRNAFAAIAMGFVQLGLSMMLQDTFFIPRTYLLFGLLFALVSMTQLELRRLERAEVTS